MAEFVLDAVGLAVALDNLADRDRITWRARRDRKVVSVDAFCELEDIVLVVFVKDITPVIVRLGGLGYLFHGCCGRRFWLEILK